MTNAKKYKSYQKTDRKKPWLKKAKPTSYYLNSREQNKTILTVGEGQTEKLYFESFPVLSLTVEAIDLQGQSKLKLIESTEEIVKSAEILYDAIWCVFDMDVKQGEMEFSDFDNAISSGTAKGYEIAYSNDCFELWFYLHYQFTDQKHHRTFYYKELSKVFGLNYEKEGKSYEFCKNIYSILENDTNASQLNAIERAKTLFESYQYLVYHKQNPTTKVYELVELLNENCRK
ncbi:MAG: RloB domain-containing protein [Balneolales bacterium]|nr:RloB domain-containing protein [Balneolales bacterium]